MNATHHCMYNRRQGNDETDVIISGIRVCQYFCCYLLQNSSELPDHDKKTSKVAGPMINKVCNFCICSRTGNCTHQTASLHIEHDTDQQGAAQWTALLLTVHTLFCSAQSVRHCRHQSRLSIIMQLQAGWLQRNCLWILQTRIGRLNPYFPVSKWGVWGQLYGWVL